MKPDAYSTTKAFRHLDVIQGVREGRPVRPVHVQIIISDLCNQACNFCSYRDPSYTSSQRFYEVDTANLKRGLRRDVVHPERNYNPPRMIPREKVIEILDDCDAMGVRAIQYTGGGEPTVHPEFAAILNATMDRALRFAVVSNGVNIAKKKLTDLVGRAEWVRISLDAAHAGTYARLRNVPEDHFHDACAAIEGLARDKHNTTVLGVGFVVTPENWTEVYDAAALAKKLGADNIRISAQFSAEDGARFASFADECAALCKDAETLTEDHFTVYNRFSARLEDLRLKRPDYSICGYQYLTTYIAGTQEVYRCCGTSYNDHGYLGSLVGRRFRDLWISQERVDAMRTFDAHSCARCQFNPQNRAIGPIIDSTPMLHEEFV